MINRATLTGRLTRDVELRYTQSGRAVGSFTLAVDRRFKNGNGDREADFINCVIWGQSAENFKNYVHKGNLVGIDGRIQTRSYENNQGNRVYVTEVVVENFSFLESRNSANSRGGAASVNNFGNGGMNNNNAPRNNGNMNNFPNTGNGGGGNANNGAKQNQPFNNPTPNNGSNNENPFSDNKDDGNIDISDDDLPF
ncbi:single-stranded DNA-binding protein [Lactobacillus sp. Sy-1]|uniref:single-stranded DNA-binding protein n=1 Tax=Lactobacillus sp. Sy-1 TaxID=2109645 RepID=UPI001C577461|nr:single-stranded DNA-binding protein [Lactobacillus sp. Sy-1]MBW1604997.1 single-stranded DNA-binding protein [Lactobacillus sp. Sy-1]